MSLKGLIPVIPTPFVNDKVELDGFKRMFERTEPYLDGYVVCGSTGEAPALSLKERIETTKAVSQMIGSDKELVVGLGHTNVQEAIEIGLAAAESGVKSALVPSPYYFPNSLNMVIDYVGKLADKTGLDLVFYDNPVTTSTKFTVEQLKQLAAAVPLIKGIKMTDHNIEKVRQLKQETSLTVFGGDDIICYRSLDAGADGYMIIAPIIYPKEFKQFWDLYQEDKREESYELFSRVVLPMIHMFGPGDEIPTTKALFKHLNIFASAETRSPLLPSSDERIREVLLGYESGLAVR